MHFSVVRREAAQVDVLFIETSGLRNCLSAGQMNLARGSQCLSLVPPKPLVSHVFQTKGRQECSGADSVAEGRGLRHFSTIDQLPAMRNGRSRRSSKIENPRPDKLSYLSSSHSRFSTRNVSISKKTTRNIRLTRQNQTCLRPQFTFKASPTKPVKRKFEISSAFGELLCSLCSRR